MSSNSIVFPSNPTEEAAYTAFFVILYAIYIPENLFRIAILVLAVALWRHEPVRSRALTPFLLLALQAYYIFFVLFINGLMYSKRTGLYTRDWNIALSILSALRYIFNILATTANVMHIMRFIIQKYFVLLQLEQYKQEVQQQHLEENTTGSSPQPQSGQTTPRPLASSSAPRISLQTRIRLCRFLLSRPFYLLAVLLPTVLIAVPLAIISLALSFTVVPSWDTDNLLYIVYLFMMVFFVAVPMVIFFVFDLVLHRNQVASLGIFKGLYWFFWDSDPLRYRIEFLLSATQVLFVPFAIIGNIGFRYGSKTFGQTFTFRCLNYYDIFPYYVLDTILGGGIVVFSVLSTLLMKKARVQRLRSASRLTMRKKQLELQDQQDQQPVSPRIEKPNSSYYEASKLDYNALLRLITDKEDGLQLFEAHTKREFSHENLLCYQKIMQFRETTDAYQRWKLANFIWDSFIASGSTLEVNLDGSSRTVVSRQLASLRDQFDQNAVVRRQSMAVPRSTTKVVQEVAQSPLEKELVEPLAAQTGGGTPAISADIFQKVEFTLRNNLADTFSRFATTIEYKQYLRRKAPIS